MAARRGRGRQCEFEVCEMAPDDEGYVHQSYLFDPKLAFNICTEHVAFGMVLLEEGTVVLEELLWDHPRYEGTIVNESERQPWERVENTPRHCKS